MDHKTIKTIDHSGACTISESASLLKPRYNMATEEDNSKMSTLGSEHSSERDFEKPVSKLSGGFLSVSENQLPAYSDISSRSGHKGSTFTVEKTVEADIRTEEGPSVFNVILKLIFALLLFSVMLSCLVASKVTLLLIGVHYDNLVRTSGVMSNDTNSAQKSNNYNKESIFIMLAMIMMIPQLFSFLITGIKVITKKKALPGPTTSAAIWVSYLFQISFHYH